MARTKTVGLTLEQRELFMLIRDWVDIKGKQPTLNDLSNELGIVRSAVCARLKALIDKGYIKSDGVERQNRVLTILKPELIASELVQIPILGDIAAGTPIWAEQNFQDWITVEKQLLGQGNFFALKICGDSMINAGINDGDIVVVKQQAYAEPGEIIAAYINGSATLKRFLYDGNNVLLKPENPAYTPIEVESGEDFRILGVFKCTARITQKFSYQDQ